MLPRIKFDSGVKKIIKENIIKDDNDSSKK